jgi:4-hydroxybenzoate polyprenyltransferase
MSKIRPYLQLMRIDRPIGALLLLWPTLWALWLAGNGEPDIKIVIIFVVGTMVMRAAGCVINDFADREIDKQVKRTKNRPLTNGSLTPKQALGLFFGLLVIAFILVLQLNRLALLVSIFALFIAALYPFCKRFTHLPQGILGIAFSMGIPMAYAAITNTIPWQAWILFIANYFWIVAYDTQYAMVDRDDDEQIGVKSTAILFGQFDNLAVGILHIIAIILLGVVGWINELSWPFYPSLVIAICLAGYQQYLCQDRIRENCLRAFLNNNWIGAVVFFGIVIGLRYTNITPL